MGERIYTRSPDGELEPLEEEPFSLEDELQALIARYPQLLDGEQMRPGDPRRWILITREMAIAERPESSSRWSLDHLIVDQDALPTLVEVKRGSNPEIRRNIVGQMLEYAAHAAETWTASELRHKFEATAIAEGLDPGAVLGRLLQADEEPDADRFWDGVATNLAAKRLRLLFVADEIPDSLERVVEFLNEQMPGIEVLAVEIKQYRGKETQTLVPRVLGRTAKASGINATGPRRSLTRESFLAELSDGGAREVVSQLLDVARQNGASLEWGSASVSVRGRCSVWPYPVTVAWLFLPGAPGWLGLKDISFGAAIFDYVPPPGEELRNVLARWADQFSGDEFSKDVSGRGAQAWSVDYAAAARHITILKDRLAQVFAELARL